MERELILSTDVSHDELEESFNVVCSCSGIIEASTSYLDLLENVLGYVKEECKKDNIDDAKIRKVLNRTAKVINSAETSNVNKNKQEIKEIKRIVIDNLINSNDKNIDDFDFGVVDKLNINLNDELYKFIKDKITNGSLPKRQIINYILEKYDILPKDSVELCEYDDIDFIDYIIKNRMTKSIALSFENIYAILRKIIEDEQAEYDRAIIYGLDRSGYESRYPSLARVLLLIDTKEEIEELKKKHKNDSKFVEYLDLFKGMLSNYDKSFMTEMKVNIPVGRFKNATKCILAREISANTDFLYNAEETVSLATHDGLEEKVERVEGMLKAKEIMACLPDSFKDKMYGAYNEVEDNKYAILLSKIIAKYCTTRDGKKYTPSKVQVLLLNAYKQFIENLSNGMENNNSSKK